ncbi:MAG: hypothetical protein ACUZ77_09755, partial [Candidatus Brocadiales bacterium]
WRIIYSKDIRKLLESKGHKDVVKLFKNPRDKEYHEYYNGIKGATKPEYLIPLDGWLSMIIYPSLDVKNEVHGNKEIRDLIKGIKKNEITHCTKPERKNAPIEVDLDACRNF